MFRELILFLKSAKNVSLEPLWKQRDVLDNKEASKYK